MEDHFVVLVDGLPTESTLEAAIENRNWSQQAAPSAVKAVTTSFSSDKMDYVYGSSPKNLVECRICKDEDEYSNMETPCSCCGSLKYAHRICIQRWCNEKGDTICEICHQQFEPGYTAPPQLFRYGDIPMNFSGNWEISRRDLHNFPFIAMVETNPDFLDPDYDEYSALTSRNLMFCRVVTVIFIVLLVLRHTLPIIISGEEDYSFALFILLLLGTVGILLSIFIIVRAVTVIQRCRRQQDLDILPLTTSEDESEQPHLDQPRRIRVH